ncbi:MAG TPA: cysteine--tRNA ligase [Bdellovibrionota bacterium]|nr:cysteine--tRNA ligase [Bdellovibrionota bacterium]
MNTFSGKIEPFEPLVAGKVTMYVCGPTVYDHAHIGHGRAYISYDAIVRYLRFSGLSVRYVRNITDVDDKIIRKSNEEKLPFGAVASRYTKSFHEDMAALGLLEPDEEPLASETMPEIIGMVEKLVKKGKAYAAGGDVYFSIPSFEAYGKLSKKDVEDLEAGARVEPGEHKKDPLDFALWKGAKPGEPSWPSPWGAGRPGWHIECSAMAEKLLGESIDIHAGGRDLIFPHHENEIAQSESAHGKPFAKYWLHNGFVNLNKEKMSKSLGNIVTLKSLLAKYHPEALRLYLLSSHYRSPIDFFDGAVEEAAKGLDRMYRVLLAIPEDVREGSSAEKYARPFREAMDDDFNTAKAIAVLFDAVKEANRLQQKAETVAEAMALRATVIRLANVLGLLQDDPQSYFQSIPGKADFDRPQIESLIAQRAEARRTKDFQRADRIRDELKALRVIVEDSPEGTTWRISDTK